MNFISTKNTGLQVGSEIPNLIQSPELKEIHIYQSLIFFISVDCARCIELLPFISLISQNYNDYHLYIFSTGDEEINKEIRDYFEWKFPVITLSSKEMDDVYKVKIHPFVIISNNTGKVVNKGVVYNSNDMMMLINEGR